MRTHSIRRLMAVVALTALTNASAAPTDDRSRAEAATQALGSALRTALMTTVQAQGAAAAVGFCQDQAPRIAAEVAARQGVRIGRVGVRTRSRANMPVAWQQSVLEDFGQGLQAGADPATLRYAEGSALPAGVSLRYMQPIMTEGPCLVCHGTAVEPEVATAIAARYPDDAAVGFKAGELRGAFWVEVPSAAAPPSADARATITMTEDQRRELQAQMRAHLESVHIILAGLAAGDWSAIEGAAAAFGPGRGQGAHSFRSALPDGWFSFARPMHQAMQAAQQAASLRQSDAVIAALAAATAQCSACHASFRVQAP